MKATTPKLVFYSSKRAPGFCCDKSAYFAQGDDDALICSKWVRKNFFVPWARAIWVTISDEPSVNAVQICFGRFRTNGMGYGSLWSYGEKKPREPLFCPFSDFLVKNFPILRKRSKVLYLSVHYEE